MLDGIIDGIKEFFFEMFKGSTESFLNMITELFQKSVDTVQTNVSETPTEFSQTIVDNLRVISDTAILPVAGLILTYVFCYELYQLVVEKNRGGDFERFWCKNWYYVKKMVLVQKSWVYEN
ncbi:VirB6/TrbL-like conjugal transfer protein, CD1112 family [Bacillus toyonensis]|uniref:VirB6/TrbL-like conjugal transfer protein, CD1112 family n=1 Tax=Bacillus toyonensis TaxID=155322 RepID=UPI002E1A9105|nr:CD0415/CD1112 family protein [Bacillus toyonensis]